MFTALLLVLMAVPGPCGSVTACVAAAAQDALAAQFPAAAHRLEVRVRRVSPALERAAATPAVQVTWPATAGPPSGTLQVPVQQGHMQGWALVDVAVYDSVAVLRADVARGGALAADGLEMVWLETSTLYGTPLTAAAFRALNERGPLHAARRLRAGRALRADDLATPPAAETGTPLTLTYRRAAFSLTIPCTARSPGDVGDAIRVYCASSDTLYRARLTAPGHADWLETLRR